jgi:hypothetical protein
MQKTLSTVKHWRNLDLQVGLVEIAPDPIKPKDFAHYKWYAPTGCLQKLNRLN